MQKVSVFSEIERLRSVIVHTPGREVEKMTPDNA
jgi:arginine deiminase